MRNDKLLVVTQGVRGGKKHNNLQGMTKLVVTKGFNEPSNEITVDTFMGLGNSYKPMETALINITFQSGKQFNGTFADLESKLFGQG